MIFLAILGIIIAILAILFAIQNSTLIAISLGAWQFQESLAIILLVTLGLGIIVSSLLSIPAIIKRNWLNSRQQKKIAELEEQINYQKKEFLRQSDQNQALKQSHQEVLRAFSLTDSVTDFLNQEATLKLVTYLLQQVKTRIGDSHYSSLSLFVLYVEQAKSRNNISVQEWDNSIYRAIAKRLANGITPNSLLGVTNQRNLICLTLGLTKQEAAEYGEYLIEQLTASPLQKVDETTINLKASLGGAIANQGCQIDSQSFWQQVEQNLSRAKRQFSNPIVIRKISTKTDY